MPNIYKQLDIIIADYVGYSEDGLDYCNHTGMTFPCADLDAYNSLVDECSRYTKKQMPKKHLSQDAKIVIKQWESYLSTYKENYANLG